MSVHLPVVQSSAATTAFVTERLDGPVGSEHHLWLDGNQKITASNGTYATPRANAFSLVQVEDCPASTPTCRASCYVHALESAQAELHAKYRHNSRTLRDLFALTDGGYSADQPAGRWWARRLADHLEDTAIKEFRWHVSGDLWDATYAWWVARVVELSPDVRHWIYTRSHVLTAAFVGLKNIAVNYSVDRDNYRAALPYAAAHAAHGQPVRLCYMVTNDGHVPDDLPPDSVLFPDYSLRGARGASPAEQRRTSPWWQSLTGAQRRMTCPVDFYGKGEGTRCGPCSRCIKPAKGQDR